MVPSPNERKALTFLVLLALSGSAVRVWRARLPPPSAEEAAALDRQLRRADSASTAERGPKRGARTKASKPPKTPPAPQAWPVDVDRATVAQLDDLPGIGPVLAARIVAHRDSAGGFGSIEALCEVRGIGPKTAARLRPLVTFTGPQRPVSAKCGEGSKSSRNSRKPRAGKSR